MVVNKRVANCITSLRWLFFTKWVSFSVGIRTWFSLFARRARFPPWFVRCLSQGMLGYCLQPLKIGFWIWLYFAFTSYFPFSFEFAIISLFLFFFRFAKSIGNLSEDTHGYLNAWDVQNTRTAKRGVRVCMRAPTGIPLPPTPTVQTALLSHLMGQVWVPAAQPQAWPWALPSHTTTDSHMHRHQLWPSLARYTRFHKVLGSCCPAVWGWSMQHPKKVHAM